MAHARASRQSSPLVVGTDAQTVQTLQSDVMAMRMMMEHVTHKQDVLHGTIEEEQRHRETLEKNTSSAHDMVKLKLSEVNDICISNVKLIHHCVANVEALFREVQRLRLAISMESARLAEGLTAKLDDRVAGLATEQSAMSVALKQVEASSKASNAQGAKSHNACREVLNALRAEAAHQRKLSEDALQRMSHENSAFKLEVRELLEVRSNMAGSIASGRASHVPSKAFVEPVSDSSYILTSALGETNDTPVSAPHVRSVSCGSANCGRSDDSRVSTARSVVTPRRAGSILQQPVATTRPTSGTVVQTPSRAPSFQTSSNGALVAEPCDRRQVQRSLSAGSLLKSTPPPQLIAPTLSSRGVNLVGGPIVIAPPLLSPIEIPGLQSPGPLSSMCASPHASHFAFQKPVEAPCPFPPLLAPQT